MPNRNWKERKECWKEYFLGERSKSVNFRLGVPVLASVDGDKYR